MNIETIPCKRENYGGLRSGKIRYLVVHYTGCPGDTAVSEGNYFASNDTGKTSAHYFVDETTVIRSVEDRYVAYHCGAAEYAHPECRNSNSIGVEICTKGCPGDYRFDDRALWRAAALLQQLMKQYHIPVERVVRHYDVSRKVCPAPFVGSGAAAWKEFLRMLTRYDTVEDVPVWAQETVQKLVEKGFLNGDGQGLDLSHDQVRLLVILDRAGILG